MPLRPCIPRAKLLISVLAALTLTAGAGATVGYALEADDSHASTRIIGGSQVTDQKQNPGAVLLSTSGRQHCSAMRISPTWVISARHCTEVPPEAGGQRFTIDGVWTDSVRAESGPKARVVRVIPAPKSDTLLIEIDGKTPGPVTPWTATMPKEGELVTVMGWGNEQVSGYPSMNLKKGTMVVAERTPATYFGGEDIIVREKPDAAWQGDSGGPAFTKEGKAFADLSWGNADSAGKGKRMNGYVPFDQNADWIRKTSGIAPDGPQYYYTPGMQTPPPGQPSQPAPQPQPTQPAPQPTQPAPWPTQPAPQPTQPAPWPTQPAPQPTQPAPKPTPTAPRPTQPAPWPTQPGQPQPGPTRPRPTWPGMP